MNKGVPPARFGKNFDLPLSFHRSQFFHWPAAFYFILKNDAESSSFELLLDVFSKYFHKVIATATGRVDVGMYPYKRRIITSAYGHRKAILWLFQEFPGSLNG